MMIKTLAKQLLVGTHRIAQAPEGLTAEMITLFENISSLPVEMESQILYRCALASAFETAAYLPNPKPSADIQPAEPDARQACSAPAGRILQDALTRSWPMLVIEWIRLTSPKQIRPPFGLIPALLQFSTRFPVLARSVDNIIGPRGHWLAQLNPKWKGIVNPKITLAPDLSVWEEGTLNERCDFIAQLRKTQPDKSRELIQDGLKGDNTAARARILALFQDNLSPDDEVVLEKLLDDRSVEVRQVIASLLSQIPGSHLSQRMQESMNSYISMDKGILKKKYRVEPPEKINDAMKRDGIQDKTMGKLGSRATMLMQATALTPLGWWQQKWDLLPDQTLAMVLKTDWKEALVYGLAQAAITQSHVQWLLTLLSADLPGKLKLDLDKLIRALPRNQLEKWVLSALSAKNVFMIGHLFPAKLDLAQGPWSPEISHLALKSAKAAIALYPSNYVLKDHINQMAFYLHPDVFAQASAGWPENHDHWAYYADKAIDFFEIIKLRSNLYKELL